MLLVLLNYYLNDFVFVCILFLVEKSLAKMNCLIACLSVCTSLIGRRIMLKSTELFYMKLHQKVIGVGESESAVSFN